MSRLLPSDPRRRAIALGAAGVVLGLLVLELALPGQHGHRGVPTAIVFGALVDGAIAAMTAAGLVLVYRTTHIINFAQLAIGAVGAQLVFQLVRYERAVPFPVALLLGLAFSGVTGAVFDLVFGRRFARAPRLVLTVLTIALAPFLTTVLGGPTGAIAKLPFFPPLAGRPLSDLTTGSLRPYLPFGGFHFTVGGSGIPFGFAHVFSLELAGIVLLGLGAFYRLTRAGAAVRALAENSERAALLGISVGALSTAVWAIAGILSGATVTLSGFVSNPGAAYSASPLPLLLPLAAAVLARFKNLPAVVGWAIGLTVLTQAFQYAYASDVALVQFGLFAVVTVGLLLQQRDAGRAGAGVTASWEASEEVRPVPRELARLAGVRVIRYLGAALLLGGLLLFPFVVGAGLQTLGARLALTGIVAVSLVVLTGWAGQVSLGQYAFMGVGAVVGGSLMSNAGVTFWLAVPFAAVITGLVAVVVGLPALRVRGLFLAVATFALAVAVAEVLFNPRYFGWLLPSTVSRPTFFFLNFTDERSMYFLCVATFLISVAAVSNLRRSRLGRLLIAMRENEANVQSFGVNLVRLKLTAFGISGALCGLAGAVFAAQLRTVTASFFDPLASFSVFVFSVVGGVGSVAGALLGASYYNILTYITRNSRNVLVIYVGSTLPLVVLWVAPGGLLSLIVRVRDGILRIVAQRRQLVVPSLFAGYDPDVLARRLIPLAEPSGNAGLNALPTGDRYALQSELYRGAASEQGRAAERASSSELTRVAERASLSEQTRVAVGGKS